MPDYEKAARKAAKRYGIDPDVFVAQLRQESGLRPGLTSSAGAQGIAQFMPATAKQYGVNLGDGRASDDLDGAARYMRDNLDRTGEDYAAALSIYNSGRADAYKDPNFAGGQTYNYVKTILGGAKPKKLKRTAAPAEPATETVTTPGVDNSGLRRQAVGQFLQRGGVANSQAVLALAGTYGQLADTPGTTQTVPADQASPSRPASPKLKRGGTVTFDGKRVARWIGEALEYARSEGWQGSVNSGYRSDAEQKRIYDSGVRPAAQPRAYGGKGSNHEFTMYPGGAVDVSDPETLARILKRSKWRDKLVYAGAKDPVHFSKPHNGSY